MVQALKVVAQIVVRAPRQCAPAQDAGPSSEAEEASRAEQGCGTAGYRHKLAMLDPCVHPNIDSMPFEQSSSWHRQNFVNCDWRANYDIPWLRPVAILLASVIKESDECLSKLGYGNVHGRSSHLSHAAALRKDRQREP